MAYSGTLIPYLGMHWSKPDATNDDLLEEVDYAVTKVIDARNGLNSSGLGCQGCTPNFRLAIFVHRVVLFHRPSK